MQKDLKAEEFSRGDRYYIDRPVKVDGKVIFDGKFFLAERTYYIVAGVATFIQRNHSEKVVNAYDYVTIPIKIRPDYFLDQKWQYSQWETKMKLRKYNQEELHEILFHSNIKPKKLERLLN